MKKTFAVFMDRDGVVNYWVDYLHDLKDLKIISKVPEAIKLLNKFEIPAIVVTNQPAVAKGLLTEAGVKKIHHKIRQILAQNGARIDRFYFCPHHPNADLPKYRVNCRCRKPETALFKKASKEFEIDLKKSYVVGDSFRDIETGKKLGATTVTVETGTSDFGNSKPDFKVKDLYKAVKLVLKKEGFA